LYENADAFIFPDTFRLVHGL